MVLTYRSLTLYGSGDPAHPIFTNCCVATISASCASKNLGRCYCDSISLPTTEITAGSLPRWNSREMEFWSGMESTATSSILAPHNIGILLIKGDRWGLSEPRALPCHRGFHQLAPVDPSAAPSVDRSSCGRNTTHWSRGSRPRSARDLNLSCHGG